MNTEGVGIARLIGGAGTGKTTELLRIMEGALEHFNHDPMMLGFLHSLERLGQKR